MRRTSAGDCQSFFRNLDVGVDVLWARLKWFARNFPNLSFSFRKQLDLFERRRSLHPKVKVRTPVSVQLDKCELLVQVVGAKNIPLRTEHDPLAGMFLFPCI